MGWMIAIAFVLLFALCLLFIHGASVGRSEQYQQELDDEQMHRVSK
ncbi:MAG: hypothetical protein LUG93_11180 [Lachnospiraceae bacterium]|nr:hypothetical protein [Lachnospiraceae bacterium]